MPPEWYRRRSVTRRPGTKGDTGLPTLHGRSPLAEDRPAIAQAGSPVATGLRGTDRYEGRTRHGDRPLAAGMHRMLQDRRTISITQACEQVGVSRRTIYNWMASGKVEYVRTAGGAVRIFADTLWRDPTTGPTRVPRPAHAVAPGA